MLKDLTSARHFPSMSPLITVNLCHTQRQVTVAVQRCSPSSPFPPRATAAGRMIHLRAHFHFSWVGWLIGWAWYGKRTECVA